MPTLNELFRPFRAGADATAANPDLKPERLAGIEAGVDYARGPFKLSLTAFANRLKDAIANVTLGHGPGVFPGVGFVAAGGTYSQRQNVDAVKVRGIEASARMDAAGRGARGWRQPDPCAHGRQRRGVVPERAAAGADAQVRRHPVGQLAIGREGRGPDPAPRRGAI